MAGSVEKVYSGALFETALEKEEVEMLYEEAEQLAAVWEKNPEFGKLLTGSDISTEEKCRLLKRVFEGQICGDMEAFLSVIINKGRPEAIPAILEAFAARVRRHKKVGAAYVTSAVKLSAGQRIKLENRLLETTGSSVIRVDYGVDAGLLGGLVVRVGDTVVDGSIKTQILDMKRRCESQ